MNAALASELTDSGDYLTPPVDTPQTLKMDRHALLNMVADYANIYEVSFQEMVNTIECESGFDTDIQSIHLYENGNREQSFGLVQIHLPAHPNVTYEQAVDAEFAIEFMAKNFSLGRQEMWTCWKQLYGS